MLASLCPEHTFRCQVNIHLDFCVREINYYLLRELENGLPVLFVGNKKDLLLEDPNSQTLCSVDMTMSLLTQVVWYFDRYRSSVMYINTPSLLYIDTHIFDSEAYS